MNQPTILDADTEGYRLLQELVAGKTLLCCDVSENIVVLKRLEDDCLHRSALHPSIKDRLARVRELAHPRIATLRTVERWRGSPYLVWMYLDGEHWSDAITRAGDLPGLCSALAASVDALHEIGIVHGNIHGKNAIVRPDRQVWLTHVSPYLYTDPKADTAAVAELLRQAAVRLPGEVLPKFEKLVSELESGQRTLREFSYAVREIEKDEPAIEPVALAKDSGYRMSSVMLAMFILLLGVAGWFAVDRVTSKLNSPMPTTFPTLRPASSAK